MSTYLQTYTSMYIYIYICIYTDVYTTLRWIYLLDPPRGLGTRSWSLKKRYSTLLYSTLPYSTLLYSALLSSPLVSSPLLSSPLLSSPLPYSTLRCYTLRYHTTFWYLSSTAWHPKVEAGAWTRSCGQAADCSGRRQAGCTWEDMRCTLPAAQLNWPKSPKAPSWKVYLLSY